MDEIAGCAGALKFGQPRFAWRLLRQAGNFARRRRHECHQFFQTNRGRQSPSLLGCLDRFLAGDRGGGWYGRGCNPGVFCVSRFSMWQVRRFLLRGRARVGGVWFGGVEIEMRGKRRASCARHRGRLVSSERVQFWHNQELRAD